MVFEKIASKYKKTNDVFFDIMEFLKKNNQSKTKEEKLFPMIIHQKISKEIAEKIFEITDKEILNAIECHTTLKANPSKLDMILFIADKIKWDREGEPPYLGITEFNLKTSLESGVMVFINYLMENKKELKIMHPQLIEAYKYFKETPV
jgi:HD superfamily phosphohydrolase YqeK